MTESKARVGKSKMFGAATAVGTSIAAALATSGSDQEGGYEQIAVERIQPDPENPRRLGLDPANPAAIGEDDPERERKLEALEYIKDLAVSIESVGLNQPITVYRHGSMFRIATGERRFLAHRLLNKPTIKTIILKERPSQLRLLQWVENFQRQDLSLWERLENLKKVFEEASNVGRESDSAEQVRELTGLKRSQAFQYLAVLRGPEDVVSAIADGRLNSLTAAADIARMHDPVARARAIREVEAGGGAVTKALPAPAKKAQKMAGRPKLVRLGGTPHTDIVRLIMEKVAGDKYSPDWTDPVAVSKAFQQMLRDLERKVS